MNQSFASFLGDVVLTEVHLALLFSSFWLAWVLGLIVKIGIVLDVL